MPDTTLARLSLMNSRVLRGLQRLWFWDVWHAQPSAPMSWRYFLPGQSAEIRLHKHLWWHSRYKLPGLLWLPLEIMRWAYWQFWAHKRLVSVALAKYGHVVKERFGVSIEDQKTRLIYWAKSWCINPYVSYSWRLYQQDVDGLAIIYESETQAYHALQNRMTGACKLDHQLLGDKIALAETLSKAGIPMVPTAKQSKGDWNDLLLALQDNPRLFCKLRSGNQGESAFAVWLDENGMQGMALDGAELPDEKSVCKAWQILAAKGELLMQPLLVNHPVFNEVTSAFPVISLRIVTRSQSASTTTWWAELQVAVCNFKEGNHGFWRFPVNLDNGGISTLGHEWLLQQDWQDDCDKIWQRLSALVELPYWQQVCQHSLSAHRKLPKVWAIAWDWVITPDGPVLLEGNSGWGLEQVQQQGINLVSAALVE